MNSEFLTKLPADLRDAIGTVQWELVDEGESDARVLRLRADDTVRYLKVSRHAAQFAVRSEKARLDWLAGRVPVPEVLHYSEDEAQQYLLMSALPGLHPMHDDLKWSPQERIDFLAAAAQRFHALPPDDCPFSWRVDAQIAAAQDNVAQGRVRADLFETQWQSQTPQALFEQLLALKPDSEDLAVVHGDLYPMNIRAHPQTRQLLGFIDVGAMGIADRYTDLALIANAIKWHLGESWIPRFFAAYGIAQVDWRKLEFYQLLNEFF